MDKIDDSDSSDSSEVLESNPKPLRKPLRKPLLEDDDLSSESENDDDDWGSKKRHRSSSAAIEQQQQLPEIEVRKIARVEKDPIEEEDLIHSTKKTSHWEESRKRAAMSSAASGLKKNQLSALARVSKLA